MFIFDDLWRSLGTSILENLRSAAINTRSRLTSRLSLCFLWLCNDGKFIPIQAEIAQSQISNNDNSNNDYNNDIVIATSVNSSAVK